MKTNELKKGVRVQLRNGWYATIADNMKGNTRLATVEGIFTETGSVYSHDIVRAQLAPDKFTVGEWVDVEHTPAQLKLREQVERFF